MAQVFLTVDTEMQLRRTAGLRASTKCAVLDVPEAALEIGKPGMGHVESTTIWGAEPARQAAA